MIKGVNKSVIVLKTDKDSRFESAYFVLRPHRSERRDAGAIAEARSLIRAGEGDARKRGKRFFGVLKAVLCFAAGVIFGAGGAVLVVAVFR